MFIFFTSNSYQGIFRGHFFRAGALCGIPEVPRWLGLASDQFCMGLLLVLETSSIIADQALPDFFALFWKKTRKNLE